MLHSKNIWRETVSGVPGAIFYGIWDLARVVQPWYGCIISVMILVHCPHLYAPRLTYFTHEKVFPTRHYPKKQIRPPRNLGELTAGIKTLLILLFYRCDSPTHIVHRRMSTQGYMTKEQLCSLVITFGVDWCSE